MKPNKLSSIDMLLSEIEAILQANSPELIPIYKVYANEARFGREYISKDLKAIENGSSILEIGAGSLLLSCQLVKEGYAVTALEPIAEGFSHFKKMQEMVIKWAEVNNCKPNLINKPAEELELNSEFDFAYSVNVMEHVSDIESVIRNTCTALKPEARYRFTCPNYIFPYEPHFNIPLIINKKITEKLFSNKIYHNSEITDSEGLWKSLNWISTFKIKKCINKLDKFKLSFEKDMLVNTLNRAVIDPEFAKRRSKGVIKIITGVVKLNLHKIFMYMPISLQPSIDCVITRLPEEGSE